MKPIRKIKNYDLKPIIKALGSLLIITCIQYVSIRYFPLYHDMMKYLYFIPIILAAYQSGWVWGIVFALTASFISSMHLLAHSSTFYPEFIIQALIFILGGGILGLLSDRDRHKRSLIEKSKIDFLKALSSALDARDTYTEGHSFRVAQAAIKIGWSAGLKENDLEILYQAGLMHDIGKIGVPDEILRKESSLDNNEYEQIKRHSTIGSDILSHVNLLKELRLAVRHHHERFDGTGYPDKLSGDLIPLFARILAIADAYDAMTSQRTYNNRKNVYDAVAEIEKKACSQFDPVLVSAFKKASDKFHVNKFDRDLIDPICGMKITPLTSETSIIHKGEIHFFCSENCKLKYKKNIGMN